MAVETQERTAKDRFDVVPDDLHRIGAHRTRAHTGRGWIGIGWAVLAIAVLTVSGLWGLSLINPDFEFGFPASSSAGEAGPGGGNAPADNAEPVLDANIVITVLNGTPTSGLSNTVGDYLVAQGWEGAAFGTGARVTASTDDVETTLVIYNDPVNEGAARAMLATLGVGEVRLANTYPASPLAVLLGSDFVLPEGSESAPAE